MNKSREELAAEANRVREDLVETVGQLDHLRRDPLGVGDHVTAAMVRVAVVGGIVVAAGGAAALLLWRRETSSVRLRRDRLRLAADAWRRPSRFLRAEQPSWAVRVTQAVAMALLTSAAKMLSKQVLARAGAHPGHPLSP